jgi:hypothetical protein
MVHDLVPSGAMLLPLLDGVAFTALPAMQPRNPGNPDHIVINMPDYGNKEELNDVMRNGALNFTLVVLLAAENLF